MIIVFDGDIFEEKVKGYDELIEKIEESDIVAVTNPNFELFLLLHLEDSYKNHIKGHESEFLSKGYHHAYDLLRDITGMNSKKNPKIGDLAQNVKYAIKQEKSINQDVHNCKGALTSNVGLVIESIINERPLI